MTANEVLPIILYILGAILLTALIVLTVRLIITMNKVDKIVDNINGKVHTLDELFNVIGLVTGKVSTITDKLINAVVSVVEKIFNRKGDKINE